MKPIVLELKKKKEMQKSFMSLFRANKKMVADALKALKKQLIWTKVCG
jgi:hypothetical protein